MTANAYHLAQINIAKAIAPLDSPVMKGFVDQLDAINALAEDSPGFVWRLQTEEGDATAIQMFEDPQIIVNLSLWASMEDLKAFVYRGDHLSVLRQKAQWFEKPQGPALVLWWIPAGELPTLEMARQALQRLEAEGPTAEAFTFAKPFPPPAV